MAILLSPLMNLPIPGVGSEAGPQYATDVNNAFTILDSHNHSPGSGSQITPAGLNINSALPLNLNFLTQAAGITFAPQASAPANLTSYANTTDLFFVDGLGNNIQITASGGIAGTPGSIANLTTPASATYVSASSTFVWQSNTNIAANMDFGSAIMRNLSPNSMFALTLSPPANLGTNYTLTLPALPTGLSLMALDASGNITAPYAISGGLNASVLTPASVTQTQMANNSIGTPQLISASVTPDKLTAVNIVKSSSSGNFNTTGPGGGVITNLNLVITTTGRPVMVMITSDSTGAISEWGIASGNSQVSILRGSTTISIQRSVISSGVGVSIATAMSVIDTPSAGTYTYSVTYANNSTNFGFNNAILVAYEL